MTLDRNFEAVLTVAINLQRVVNPECSFEQALIKVCEKAKIHLHPRQRRALEKSYDDRSRTL